MFAWRNLWDDHIYYGSKIDLKISDIATKPMKAMTEYSNIQFKSKKRINVSIMKLYTLV